MKDLTILLTCALGDYMESTIRCFKSNPDNRKVRIIGTDIKDYVYHWFALDEFYMVPMCNEPDYIPTLVDICEKEKVDIVVPFNTIELEMFYEHISDFERVGAKVLTAGKGIYEVNNKISLYNSFKGTELAQYFPMQFVVNSYFELSCIIGDYPEKTFCLKKSNSCGGRGFKVINDTRNNWRKDIESVQLESLENAISEKTIVQEYLYGNEYSVDILANNGKVLYAVAKINLDMMNGVAMNSVVVDSPLLCEICSMIVEQKKLNGNIGFDLKCNKNGKPYVIDCNPRLTATVSLCEAAGVNLPYYGLKLLLGETVPLDNEITYGIKCIRKTKDYFFKDE